MIGPWITDPIVTILFICLYNITLLDGGCVAYNTLTQHFNYVLDNCLPTYLKIIYYAFCILNSTWRSIISQHIAFIHLTLAHNVDFTSHSIITDYYLFINLVNSWPLKFYPSNRYWNRNTSENLE